MLQSRISSSFQIILLFHAIQNSKNICFLLMHEDHFRQLYIDLELKCLSCAHCSHLLSLDRAAIIFTKASQTCRAQEGNCLVCPSLRFPPNYYLYYSLRLSLATDAVTVLTVQYTQHIFSKSRRMPSKMSISIPPNGQ